MHRQKGEEFCPQERVMILHLIESIKHMMLVIFGNNP